MQEGEKYLFRKKRTPPPPAPPPPPKNFRQKGKRGKLNLASLSLWERWIAKRYGEGIRRGGVSPPAA